MFCRSSSDTKRRILIVKDMFEASHSGMSITQIIDKLEREYDITVKRLAIYDDIATLTCYGMNIQMYGRGNQFVYKLEKQLSEVSA